MARAKLETEITRELLAHAVSYNPETGVFVWRNCGRPERNGLVAGFPHNEGYWCIRIQGKTHRAHRLAWLMQYGDLPSAEIDHINGVRSDNRIGNLRRATSSENKYNKAARADNASGFKGVYWSPPANKWAARIGVNKRRIFLGHFDSPEGASAAYNAAAAQYHNEFAYTGQPHG